MQRILFAFQELALLSIGLGVLMYYVYTARTSPRLPSQFSNCCEYVLSRIVMIAIIVMVTACAVPQVQKHITSIAESSLSPAAGGEKTSTGEGEKKKTADEKPKPDSVISSVLSLPTVKKWEEWIESKSNGNKIVAWGEYVKEVEGKPCWSIVVAEETSKGATYVWKRFCMQQNGLEVWVESPLGAKNTDEVNYITYDVWRTQCSPTYNSSGMC